MLGREVQYIVGQNAQVCVARTALSLFTPPSFPVCPCFCGPQVSVSNGLNISTLEIEKKTQLPPKLFRK